MKMSRILIPALAPLAVAVSSGAFAGDSGYVPAPPPMKKQEFIVGVGGSYVSPRSDQVSFVDDSFQTWDAFRATIDPSAEWGWFINGEWKPTDHWGFELGYIDGDTHSGGSRNGYFSLLLDDDEYRYGDLARFEAEISTATVKWYPMDPDCMFQPYMGGGISYTDFNDNDFRGRTRNDLADLGLRGDFNLGYSWGYTWELGMDFNFGHDSAWLVNVAAIYNRADTDMRLRVYDDVPPPADVEPFYESFSADYTYDPWTFNLGVGYKFSF